MASPSSSTRGRWFVRSHVVCDGWKRERLAVQVSGGYRVASGERLDLFGGEPAVLAGFGDGHEPSAAEVGDVGGCGSGPVASEEELDGSGVCVVAERESERVGGGGFAVRAAAPEDGEQVLARGADGGHADEPPEERLELGVGEDALEERAPGRRLCVGPVGGAGQHRQPVGRVVRPELHRAEVERAARGVE